MGTKSQLLAGLGLAAGILAGQAPANAQLGCTPQTKSQLLNSFSDNAAPGSITPQVMRNFVCSISALVTPPLVMSESGGISPNSTMFSLTSSGAVPNDNPLLSTTWTIANNGTGNGTPALNQTLNHTIIQNNPLQGAWANYDNLEFDGSSSSSGGSFITRYMQATLNDPMGGSSGSSKLWAAIIATIDFTKQPSTTAGLIRTVEMDMEASGLDNGNFGGPPGRTILSVVGFPGRTYAGTDTQITYGIDINQAGGSSSTFRYIDSLHIAGQYKDAAIRIDANPDNGTAPAIGITAGNVISFNHPTDTATVGYNGTVQVAGLPWRVPGYALASLPAVTSGNQGSLVWCNNCVDFTGAANGALMVMNSSGGWETPWGTSGSTSASAAIIIGGSSTGVEVGGASSFLGFYGATAITKATPTGACAGNTGCQALRDALGNLGFINTGSITN